MPTSREIRARLAAEIHRHTTRTPLNYCLDCNMLIDAGTPSNVEAPDVRPPQGGDLAICIQCAHVMIYADDLTVRDLTDEEVVEVASDPDMVEAVNKIAEFNKREHGVG